MRGAPAVALLRGFTADQFVEIAFLTAGGALLIEQRQPTLVEFLEELIPVNMLKRLLTAVSGKIEAQHSYVTNSACTAHAGGPGTTLFGPATDLIMICAYVRLCSRHSALLSVSRCWDALRCNIVWLNLSNPSELTMQIELQPPGDSSSRNGGVARNDN